MSEPNPPLLERFKEVSYEAWHTQVAEQLGENALNRLTRKRIEGTTERPLYVRADQRASCTRTRGLHTNQAKVRQIIDHRDLEAAKQQALEDLEGGADALLLDMRPGSALTAEAITELLTTITGLSKAGPLGIYLSPRTALTDAIDTLLTLGEKAEGGLGADPLGSAIERGGLHQDNLELPFDGAGLKKLSAACPKLGLLELSTLPLHEAGSSATVELAMAAATGVFYLRAAQAEGLDLDELERRTLFRFALTPDIFLGIATLRAARRIWARITESFLGQPQSMRVSVHSSTRCQTKRDPQVNMLRGYASCFAGLAGGAELISLIPFDAAHRISTPHARRIARNTALILARESHLGRVKDPGGGSWYLEQFTEELAQEAWRLFQQIEAQDGALSVVQNGWLLSQVSETQKKRGQAVATRKIPITGVSEFPSPHETPLTPQRETEAPYPQSAHTLAAPFEALRDRADAHHARGGVVSVFLANMGPLKKHIARATFTKNALFTGGLQAIDQGGYATPQEAATAFEKSGAKACVLCGSDDQYESLAAPFARAIKASGAKLVLLAGRAKPEGVDENLYLGANIIQLLERLHQTLEVSR